MSLMKSYLSVLNENKQDSGVAADNTGELDGAKNAHKFSKDSGPDAVKDLETPEKGPHSEQAEDSMPKKVSSESRNPFDLLYNKILAQEAFGDEDLEETSDDAEENEEFSSEDMSDISDLEDEMTEDEGSEEEEVSGLEAVLDHLKAAVESLEAIVGSEESEEGMEDDENMEDGEGMEDEDSEDLEGAFDLDFNPSKVSQESVELKPVKKNAGQSLVKKTSQALKGAVAVVKKKAVPTKGVKPEGKYTKCTANPETLTSKSKQNVGGVKVGKGLFEQ
jgi:hypothetical protein